ncbi:MAG: spore coat protein U domain-containing protein [Alphaproteobacteria bacterium]|nr:spore coat protein U domain-containing protein [Alphaproteobacteria bacterium]
MKHQIKIAACLAIAALPFTGKAEAASATSNFNVKVTVNTACTVSATDLNFGTFTGSIPANSAGTSTATVSCNKGTSYALSFVTGAGPANAVGTATANMANGANPVIPAALTVSATAQTATGGNDATTINGKITAAVTNPAVGTYTVSQAIYVLY